MYFINPEYLHDNNKLCKFNLTYEKTVSSHKLFLLSFQMLKDIYAYSSC